MLQEPSPLNSPISNHAGDTARTALSMTWTANPLFAARGSSNADVEASPREKILKGLQDGFLEPSDKFTGQQILYLLAPHGSIAAIISGAINFAIGVGMF